MYLVDAVTQEPVTDDSGEPVVKLLAVSRQLRPFLGSDRLCPVACDYFVQDDDEVDGEREITGIGMDITDSGDFADFLLLATKASTTDPGAITLPSRPDGFHGVTRQYRIECTSTLSQVADGPSGGGGGSGQYRKGSVEFSIAYTDGCATAVVTAAVIPNKVYKTYRGDVWDINFEQQVVPGVSFQPYVYSDRPGCGNTAADPAQTPDITTTIRDIGANFGEAIVLEQSLNANTVGVIQLKPTLNTGTFTFYLESCFPYGYDTEVDAPADSRDSAPRNCGESGPYTIIVEDVCSDTDVGNLLLPNSVGNQGGDAGTFTLSAEIGSVDFETLTGWDLSTTP